MENNLIFKLKDISKKRKEQILTITSIDGGSAVPLILLMSMSDAP